ncbi:MAG: TatD family hydrolase [Actinomycetota bacterium]
MILIDTHAHLDMLKKTSPEEAVEMAAKWGVGHIINVGSSIAGSKKARDISKTFENVSATAGIHPHYVSGYGKKEEEALASLIEENHKVVAVGETGFDYYRNLSDKDDQLKAFESQIEIALKYSLPLVVHDREAHKDTLDVLKRYSSRSDFKAVLHCFSGDSRFAKEVLDLGIYISFTGVLTFPNAQKTEEAARRVPMDRIFLETDAPFLAPQPKRGRENQPAYVTYIAEKLALLKNLSVEEVAKVTTKNAINFFGLKN